MVGRVDRSSGCWLWQHSKTQYEFEANSCQQEVRELGKGGQTIQDYSLGFTVLILVITVDEVYIPSLNFAVTAGVFVTITEKNGSILLRNQNFRSNSEVIQSLVVIKFTDSKQHRHIYSS